VDGRIVGTITATVALIVLGVLALGLYTSLAGLLVAGSIAANRWCCRRRSRRTRPFRA